MELARRTTQVSNGPVKNPPEPPRDDEKDLPHGDRERHPRDTDRGIEDIEDLDDVACEVPPPDASLPGDDPTSF
jgi:hypothetical protein